MDQLADILEFLPALWNRRWQALAAAWVFCPIGWAVVLMLPDRYEASSRVYVDTKTALRPVLQGIAVETDVDSQLDAVRQALLSRPHLEKVARTTGLDRKARVPADLDDILADLKKSITIVSSGNARTPNAADSLYTITYANSNRDQTLGVVRSLVDSFVEGTLGNKRSGAEEAQAFLRQQIKDYAERLANSEALLADFKKKNLGLVPGDNKGDYFSRLNGEMTALQQSETNLAIALSRRSELSRQLQQTRPYLAGTSGSTQSPSNAPQTDLSARVQESEAKLQELLLHYTDKYPEVMALRDTIAELKRQEATELADIAKGGSGSGAIRSLAANPVYQNIQMQLGQADVEIASLRGAISQHQAEIASLQRVVNTAPEVEQEYARLYRDYDVTKAEYTALVDRLEKTKVSDDAENTGIVKFEVIDPPAADIKPVWPNRTLLSAAVLIGGPVVGVAFVLLLGALRPTLSGARALARMTDLPVVGVISRMVYPERVVRDRRDRIRLTLASAALAVVCIGLIIGQGVLLRLVRGLSG